MEQVLIWNEEAERDLLGRVILNNDLVFFLGIETKDFFHQFNQQIFEKIKSDIESGTGANPFTLKKFVSDLTEGKTSVTDFLNPDPLLNATQTLKILRDFRAKRELKEISAEIAKNILSGEKNAQEIKDIAQERFEAISLKDDKNKTITAGDAVRRAFESKEVNLLKTGFDSIDKITGGFDEGSFIVLAGRPAMGKSSLALNIAIRHARKHGSVLFIALEASSEQFARRLVANIGSLNLSRLRKNELKGHHESEAFQRAVESVDKLPIEIKDKGGITLPELRYEIKRFASKGKGKLVVIDYIQLIRHKTKGGRTEDVTEITNTLKALAMEFKVVIIGLSQLSRAVENRDDKRPMLSDLRESGSIEQDADVVIFTFRPVYYLKDEEEKYNKKGQLNTWKAEMQRLKNVAYAIMAKVREGEPADAKLHFEGEFQRFTEIN